ADAAGAAFGGFAPRGLGVVNPEGDVADAIAVDADVLGDLAFGLQGRGQDESNFILHEDVAGAVASAGLGSAIGHQAEAEGRAVEVRRLAGVADVVFDV